MRVFASSEVEETVRMLHNTTAYIRNHSLAFAAADGSWISIDGPLVSWRSLLLFQAEGFEGH